MGKGLVFGVGLLALGALLLGKKTQSAPGRLGYTFYCKNPPPTATTWRLDLFSTATDIASLDSQGKRLSSPIGEPIMIDWNWLLEQLHLPSGQEAALSKVMFVFDSNVSDMRTAQNITLKVDQAAMLDWRAGGFSYNIVEAPWVPLTPPSPYVEPPPSVPNDRFILYPVNIPDGQVTGWQVDIASVQGGTLQGKGTASFDYSRNIPSIIWFRDELEAMQRQWPFLDFGLDKGGANAPNLRVIFLGMPPAPGEMREILWDTRKYLGPFTFTLGHEYDVDWAAGTVRERSS